ncbi:MAG: DUF6503 family protein [Marinoscillum sp.]
MNRILLGLIVLTVTACQTKSDQAKPVINKVFDAHGGYAVWEQMQAIRLVLEDEVHLISLKDRKILITNPEKQIGFDGEKVWVSPGTADASGAHFYYNLYFYFFGMPFVLGDPGINYELLPSRELLGKEYTGIKASFESGVGNSSEDNYILWVDPETYKVEWLMYTVTYQTGESSDQYNLIRYSDWVDRKGLIVPQKLQWHVYKNDTVGEVRNEVVFTKIQLSKDRTSEVNFQMPENAQVAPVTSKE